jgi:hypothetical protein
MEGCEKRNRPKGGIQVDFLGKRQTEKYLYRLSDYKITLIVYYKILEL